METSRTLSAGRVLNRSQPTDEPSRRTVDAAHEDEAVSEFRLLIDGKLVEGAGTLDVINPATGRTPDGCAPGGSGPAGARRWPPRRPRSRPGRRPPCS